MQEEKDYRNTEYCPKLKNVSRKKKILEAEIKDAHPKSKIMYRKVSDRKDRYIDKFAKIYNGKCAYCGVIRSYLPAEFFEIDHFINEKSFPDTTEGKIKAGRVENLVWSCMPCNRGKNALYIEKPYDKLLNPDNGNIAKIFIRDSEYYIRIREAYQQDMFIRKFYEMLHLEYETKRLDYLLLQIQRAIERTNDDNKRKQLMEEFYFLLKKRNGVLTEENEK